MPRIARRDLNTCFYHAIVQGMKKEFIFNTPIQIEKYKEIIVEKLKDSNIIILAYCIMNNHAHFLIYSEKSEYLSKFMQKLNSTYSNYYNKTNNRVGYVFRNRFYSQGINDNKQLFNCLRYIHNNPVKAKITVSMKDYKYSSYNEFLGKKEIICSKGLDLLFNDMDNFKDVFYSIHQNQSENNYDKEFYDIKEMEISEFRLEFKRKYNTNIKKLKGNRNLLEIFIKESRNLTDVTIMELVDILGVCKNTVSRYS